MKLSVGVASSPIASFFLTKHSPFQDHSFSVRADLTDPLVLPQASGSAVFLRGIPAGLAVPLLPSHGISSSICRPADMKLGIYELYRNSHSR
jgi:hypothetical protein